MNRRGLTAMADAVAFMVLMMAVMSLTLSFSADTGEDPPDAGALVSEMMGAEVRISDLTSEDDDTLVGLPDLIALHVLRGEDGVKDYLEELLVTFCRGHPYELTASFGDLSMKMGDSGAALLTGYTCTVPVSTGGELTLTLRIWS